MKSAIAYVEDIPYNDASITETVDAAGKKLFIIPTIGKVSRTPGTGAAIIDKNISKYIYNGYLHRTDDLPAVVHKDNVIEYWENGLRHRANGLPAIEFLYKSKLADTKYYYVRGKLDRLNLDLPSIDSYDGTLMYFKNDVLHREDNRPAIIGFTGSMYIIEHGRLRVAFLENKTITREYMSVEQNRKIIIEDLLVNDTNIKYWEHQSILNLF